VNNLPKVVTRQRGSVDLNLRPLICKSNILPLDYQDLADVWYWNCNIICCIHWHNKAIPAIKYALALPGGLHNSTRGTWTVSTQQTIEVYEMPHNPQYLSWNAVGRADACYLRTGWLPYTRVDSWNPWITLTPWTCLHTSQTTTELNSGILFQETAACILSSHLNAIMKSFLKYISPKISSTILKNQKISVLHACTHARMHTTIYGPLGSCRAGTRKIISQQFKNK